MSKTSATGLPLHGLVTCGVSGVLVCTGQPLTSAVNATLELLKYGVIRAARNRRPLRH